MSHHDVDILDHLKRIKTKGEPISVKFDQIETLEVELRRLNEIWKSESGLDFMMKTHTGILEKEFCHLYHPFSERKKMEASWWNDVKNSLFSYLGESEEYSLSTVLDLSSNRVDHLSLATLNPLIHLKYLAVSIFNFNFHPESHMCHLETIIVKGNGRPKCPNLQELAISIFSDEWDSAEISTSSPNLESQPV
ncbi:unnamed protein product [Withania somnifera]